MELILARHGNTFAPGDQVIRVGRTLDLPLVESGRIQAQKLAQYFLKKSISFEAIYCAPLKRTQEFAQIMADILPWSLTPQTDERLLEIDYGRWSGLTDEDIKKDELELWESGGWPAHFAGSLEQTFKDVQSFTMEMTDKHQGTVLVVSSNGLLRFFLKLIPREWEKRSAEKKFKMGTGSSSKLQYYSGQWHLSYWDQKPSP